MNKYISTLALCSILGLATGCKLESGSGCEARYWQGGTRKNICHVPRVQHES